MQQEHATIAELMTATSSSDDSDAEDDISEDEKHNADAHEAARFELYGHDGPASVELRTELKRLKVPYRGLRADDGMALYLHLFENYVASFTNAISAGAVAGLVCAPPCETFVGGSYRSREGRDRYGRKDAHRDMQE